jgi:SAM-dependent methyltransferase
VLTWRKCPPVEIKLPTYKEEALANEILTENPPDVNRQFFAQEYRRSHGISLLIRRYTPFWWRRALRTPYLLALDGLDVVRGRRNALVPPRYVNYTGFKGYLEAGNEYLGYFKELCGLQPHHRVLDIGCGMGRMAVPQTGYLRTGSYEGLDIVPSGIRWCQRHISRKYPQFRFQVADIYNKQYNPSGRFKAADYRFPFADGEFDLVFLISIFSHLLPVDTDHYVSEISRMLRPGGKLLFTAFLLDDEAHTGIAAGKSTLPFVHELPGCWTTDPVTPETAVAYDASTVEPLLARHSLSADLIRLGAWSGRSKAVTYADIVTATKSPVAK